MILNEAQKLETYNTGETIGGLARKLGLRPSDILKLNANENLFIPVEFLRGLLRNLVEDIDPRVYPGEEDRGLTEALGRYLKTSPEEIVLGSGSDQLIDLVSRIILKPGDKAQSIIPTFSMYEKHVKIQRAEYEAVPLKRDFSLDMEKMLSSASSKTKLLFLSSPNNPTSNRFDRSAIQRLAESFSGLVVVDEAYADFAEDSVLDMIRRYDNLVVLRTFSKAFGLAGLRLGYAVANRALAKVLKERYQLPFSVSAMALRLGLALLDNIEVIESAIEAMKVERSSLVMRLKGMSKVDAFDSETNFVLFHTGLDHDKAYEAFLNKGIIVRNIGQILHLRNCLRVAVPPPAMSDRFIAALNEILGEKVA